MKRLILLSTVFVTCLVVNVVHADIYVSSSGTGSQDGTNCANARSAAWFNTAGNWGGGGTDIDPGDTVRLCGTFVGAANSTILTVQASGTSGNVITMLFEANATLQAPYFSTSGAINIYGKQYIKIDGGTNGIIENTDNGSIASGKTYNASSAGIYIAGGSSNIEICNLTIRNIFINTGGDSSGATDSSGLLTYNIELNKQGGAWNNISIHDNILSNARAGFVGSFEGLTASNFEFYNNVSYDHGWGMMMGAGGADSVLSGFSAHDNEFYNWDLWQFPSSAYHTDGLIIFANVPTNSYYTGSFYNNYAHGNLGNGSPTAYIQIGCGGQSFNVYNNIFECQNPSNQGACMAIWNAGGCEAWSGVQPIDTFVANNDFIGTGVVTTSGWMMTVGRTAVTPVPLTLKNNIFINIKYAVKDYMSDYSSLTTNGADYNIYYNTEPVINESYVSKTLAEFQAPPYNQEAHGLSSNPLLDTFYMPSNSSPAVGAGLDLSGIFTFDKDNRIRSVPWDIGAKIGRRPRAPENLRIN